MTIHSQAAELLEWIDQRSEPMGSGKILPRTYGHRFKERLGRIWRDSLSEPLDENAKDGMRRLADLFGWSIHDEMILRTPGVASDAYCPCINADWDWRPEALAAIQAALRLFAKDHREVSADESCDQQEEDIVSRWLEIADENGPRLMAIASDASLTVEDKQREMSKIDVRFYGKKSTQWARILSCSTSAATKNNWWRVERPKHIGEAVGRFRELNPDGDLPDWLRDSE